MRAMNNGIERTIEIAVGKALADQGRSQDKYNIVDRAVEKDMPISMERLN